MTETGHRYYWTANVKYPKAQTLTVPGDDERQAALWVAADLDFVSQPSTIERGAGRGEWFIFDRCDHAAARVILRKQKTKQT